MGFLHALVREIELKKTFYMQVLFEGEILLHHRNGVKIEGLFKIKIT